jgi:hypothetical protein
MQQRTLSLPAVLAPGVVAGLAGAIAIDLYAIAVLVFGTHSATLTGLYQYIASGAIGQAAYAGTSGVILGVALHLAIGVLWGLGYVYAASRQPQVLARPLVSGIVFGLVVLLAMQLVEVAANIYTHLPDTFELVNALIAHTLFFGIPIAYIARWRLAPRT